MMSLGFIADAAFANAIQIKEPQWMRDKDSALITSRLTVRVISNRDT